jgi:glyoxylase-like metal-dependent hydrolase (beta-lactamase superfamily II)
LAAYEAFLEETSASAVALLLTHGHWDHMADASIFQEKYSVPVHVHGDDLSIMRDPPSAMNYSVQGVEIPGCEPDVIIGDGDKLQLLGTEWIIRSVAGHTPGGVVYYVPEWKFLFSGDVLFRGKIGRSGMKSRDGTLLIEQLRLKVLTLPEDVEVLPGHGAATTVGEEARTNPSLRCSFGDAAADFSCPVAANLPENMHNGL